MTETVSLDAAARAPSTPSAAPRLAAGFRFDNSYARLPERFFAQLDPSPVPAPRLLAFNASLAAEIGLDRGTLSDAEWAQIFAGNRLADGSEPLAQAYAGHQFGGWSPQLGDGRAILLGEAIGADGARRDVQLKGSGRTPFSRMGDGRAPLGPVIREYLVSEAMHALGIPTTRSLAVVATGAPVLRETALPGGVLTRVASSHLRVGTFQYFAARRDLEALRLLTAHALGRHDPEAADAADPALALLEGVAARQAKLVAAWMSVGFVHGVMNTDNMTISGETIDFGPCAFLESYDPNAVFSSIDQFGRYAFSAQPGMAQWNLAMLAQSLLRVMGTGDAEAAIPSAQAAVDAFAEQFADAWRAAMGRKLGLSSPRAEDGGLIEALLDLMAASEADYTLTFRELADAADGADGPRARFADGAAFDAWVARWRARLAEEPGDGAATAAAMRRVNPALIPRNHRVEAAIAAAYAGDLSVFERLAAAWSRPFDPEPGDLDLAAPASAAETVTQTFCGT